MSIAQSILDSLLKIPADLRKPLISSMLFIGGTTLLPGFQTRIENELGRMMKEPVEYEKRRFGQLCRLYPSIKFIENPEEKGAGRIFMNNVRGWIGGSLVGSLKLSGEEITKEKFSGVVTDWSIGNWNSPVDASFDRELGNVGK